MEFATVEGSQYPIIIIRIYPVNPTFEQIDKLYDDLEKLLSETQGGYVAITVAPSQFINSEARVKLGNMAKEFYQKYKDREIISILVSSSTIARIMLQTIQLLFRPYSQRQLILSSEEEAIRVAQEHLAEYAAKS